MALRQTNFSAGELDPLYHGRNDLPLFGAGLRTCRNFFITKSGAAMSRPGSTYVNDTKYPEPPDPNGFSEVNYGKVRLIPFVAGDGESFVLELGSGYIRFHTRGATVEAPPGTPVEVTSYQDVDGVVQPWPYTWALLSQVVYAQVGDVLTMTHPNSPALELRRQGGMWVAREVKYSRPSPTFADVGMFSNPFNSNASAVMPTTGFAVVDPLPTPDTDHPALEWWWLFTAIVQDPTTGEVFETVGDLVSFSWDGVDYDASETPLDGEPIAIYPDMPVTLRRAETAGLLPPLEYVVLGYNAYRGRGDVFGWIGTTKTREFIDVGAEPDYAVQPPLGTNPFRLLNPDGTVLRTEKPATVGFFEERRIFGGTFDSNGQVRRGSTVFASATGDYYDFDKRLALHVAGEALEFELAARVREEIRHLVDMQKLVILTSGSARTLAGHQGSPLDHNSVSARRTDEVGASFVRPVVIDESVLFVRTKGTGARALFPTGSEDKPYVGVDISHHAGHLFTGLARDIVDWCYQEDPFGVVWAVREDGALLSLTFGRDPRMAAWGRHETDGTYEAICSVPEGKEDAVYVAVRRTLNGVLTRVIERFTSRVRRVKETDPAPVFTTTPELTDTNSLYPTDVCLDCAHTYVGAVTNTINAAGLVKFIGKQVRVIARGMAPLGPFPVVLDQNGLGELNIDLDVLPEPNAVDDAGAPIWVAHVGLAYECDLETLSVRGTAALQQKTVKDVGFELDNAKGIKAGQDFNHLKQWQQRTVADGYGVISAANVLLYTPVDNTWGKDARACLRQSLPLPVTVVGISRGVVGSDD